MNPAWSPDGAWVVFNSVAKSPARRDLPPEEGDDIWCVRADGRHLTRLTSRGSPEWNPAWGDDGRIYFSSTHTGETGIWSLRPQMRGL
ncbi:MAG: TolB family protein [Planctomycetota bacterium]